MKHECCELFRIIPKEEIKKVFKGAAAAELDYTFLAFEEVYKSVLNFVPKGKTIIDLGCAYAPQAYYFTEYSQYIGVDVFVPDIHFTTANMTLYQMSAQQFCKKVIDEKFPKGVTPTLDGVTWEGRKNSLILWWIQNLKYQVERLTK